MSKDWNGMPDRMYARRPEQDPANGAIGEREALLADYIELNMSNYGPDDVDRLNAWAIEAYDFISRAALPAEKVAAEPVQKRDDTGRLTSDYEPTPHEVKVARDAICREFGNNGTDGYYIRILKAIHGAAPQPAQTQAALTSEEAFALKFLLDEVGESYPNCDGVLRALLAAQSEPKP